MEIDTFCKVPSPNPYGLTDKYFVLKQAIGENANKLFAVPAIVPPIVSAKAPVVSHTLPDDVLYDFNTTAGKTYVLTSKE